MILLTVPLTNLSISVKIFSENNPAEGALQTLPLRLLVFFSSPFFITYNIRDLKKKKKKSISNPAKWQKSLCLGSQTEPFCDLVSIALTTTQMQNNIVQAR